MSPGSFSVRNTVLVNLLMGVILIFGFMVVTFELPVELMPNVGFNWVFVVCTYPGATPSDVEQLIVIPIEDALAGIEKVDYLASTAYEGGGFVWVVFEDLTEDELQDKVREITIEVDRVDLPDGAKEPEIDEFDTDDMIPIISVDIHGNLTEKQKNDISDDLRREFLNVNGISSVLVTGTREREIWIVVDPKQLDATAISIGEIAGSIAASTLDLPAGYSDRGREEIIIRTLGEITDPHEFSHVAIRHVRGSTVHVGDVATLVDTFETASSLSFVDGLPGVSLSISKQKKGNSLDVIRQVKLLAAELEPELPPGCSISFSGDTSVSIAKIIGILKKNAYFGGLLVIIVLLVILGFRNAFYVSLGIPISFMAAFIFMNYTGQTLNGNSLFGLVLVLGIIVDDAIIVVENCFYHFQAGKPRKVAAVVGTDEVVKPVIAATLTTVSAFLPLMLLPGIVGKFMKIVPIVVSLALVASLIECFLILPSHFAHWGSSYKPVRKMYWVKRIRKPYTRLLGKIIRNRYIVVISILVLTGASSVLIPMVGVEMFADEEVSQFFCWVTMPPGTKLETTRETLEEIEDRIGKLPPGEVEHIITSAGMQQTQDEWIFNSDVGQVIVDLYEKEERSHSLDEMILELERLCSDVPGTEKIVFSKVLTGPPTPKPVEVKVQGEYLDEVVRLADELKAELGSVEGLYSIEDNFKAGKTEYRIIVDREAAARYGLSVAGTALTARDAVMGRLATVFRDGDDDVDVIVKYPEGYFKTPADLLAMKVQAPGGAMAPLSAFARVDVVKGNADIRRFKNKKAVTITAELDKEVATVDKVSRTIREKFAELAALYPNCSLAFEGEFEEFKEIWTGIGRLFAIGIFLIYLILGTQFQSFSQPFIILLTIPFAFIGAMLGLLLSGNPFSISTMYGIVALTGVAVNDSIVMVSFINMSRAKKAPALLAVMQSGRRRLRPIILTSVTTILGLLPMTIGLGGKSPVWAPLANIIVWGLGAATILTLLVIPAAYYIVAVDLPKLAALLSKALVRRDPSPELEASRHE